MWKWFHQFGSPLFFYRFSGRAAPWCGWVCVGLFATGLYGALVQAPPDYQQKETYRIIFIHVPSAWMSLFVYVVMASAAGIGLIWRMKLADMVVASAAPIGATFTFLALITGSIWGKPTWGTWWAWDARITSMLILALFYIIYIMAWRILSFFQ